MSEADDTRTRRELAESAREYLARFIPSAEWLAGALRRDEAAPGLIYDVSEGIAWLAKALTLTSAETGFAPDAAQAADIVRAIYYGVDNGDSGYIADALEYEAIPAARSWLDAIC
ncbi:MAG: hypothetical protein LBK41_03480 [Clostridiales bacterium]|jgi:hypothetical protein|nr:hypothetical protein [Clostridiales bacterium]